MSTARLTSSLWRLSKSATTSAAGPLRRNAFNPLLTPSAAVKVAARRNVHSMPLLPHSVTFTKDGVPGLYSQRGFEENWLAYQKGLIDRLNELTAGTDYANHSAMEIAIMTARDPSLAALFNFASQAHNNHFFFDALSPVPTTMPPVLHTYVANTFTNVQNFKMEFLATANVMFGNGWVWLVLDESKRLRILATYNAGTPYGGAYRRQMRDANTGRAVTEGMPNGYVPQKDAGNIIPLLVVNCWEHAWVSEYGVWGKKEYLERWWESVDWSAVLQRYPNMGGTMDGHSALSRGYSM